MAATWVLNDDFRCPICFGQVETKLTEEVDEDEGMYEQLHLRCVECKHEWKGEL